MSADIVVDRLFEALVDGDRPRARAVINEQRNAGATAQLVLTDLFWPAYELIDRLYREDQLSVLAYNCSTRLLRVLIDQNAALLLAEAGTPDKQRRVLAMCGPSEASELGAQMAVDLLEASGFNVRFAGGAVPIDEAQALVQNSHPDVVVMFASEPRDLPEIRQLIDNLHEVGACPTTQIAVGGGVFNRADELAEEIGADLWAADPLELVETLILDREHRAAPDQRTVGRKRTKTSSRAAA